MNGRGAGVYRFLVVSVLAMLAFTASGCQHVAPWQRESLARIEQQGRDRLSKSYEAHFWMVREGPAGGTGEPGGGCGCN